MRHMQYSNRSILEALKSWRCISERRRRVDQCGSGDLRIPDHGSMELSPLSSRGHACAMHDHRSRNVSTEALNRVFLWVESVVFAVVTVKLRRNIVVLSANYTQLLILGHLAVGSQGSEKS